MNDTRVLILGCGRLGLELARQLRIDGIAVLGARRCPPSAGVSDGIHWYAIDVTDRNSVATLPTDVDYVIYTPAPGGRKLQVYEDLYKAGADNVLDCFRSSPRLRRWFQISSTSVYGESHGQWVSEETPIQSSNIFSTLVYDGECRARSVFHQKATVIRFSGIYSSQRLALMRRLYKRACFARHRYTNRIHEQDCAGLLRYLILRDLAGQPPQQVYLATDGTPVKEGEIAVWLSRQLALPPPQLGSDSALSGKRCENKRLVESGYQLRYPTYKDGYAQVIANLTEPERESLARASQR